MMLVSKPIICAPSSHPSDSIHIIRQNRLAYIPSHFLFAIWITCVHFCVTRRQWLGPADDGPSATTKRLGSSSPESKWNWKYLGSCQREDRKKYNSIHAYGRSPFQSVFTSPPSVDGEGSPVPNSSIGCIPKRPPRLRRSALRRSGLVGFCRVLSRRWHSCSEMPTWAFVATTLLVDESLDCFYFNSSIAWFGTT